MIAGFLTEGLQVLVDNIKRFGLEFYGRFYSEYPATVVSVDDPENRGRIKVNCPMLDLDNDDDHPMWVSPKFGPIVPGSDYGSYWVPDVGDRLWLSFRNGNPNDPIYQPAGFWLDNALPEDFFESVKDRGLITKAGHKIRLRDTEDKEEILVEHSGGSKVVFDSEDRIVFQTSGGDSITIDPSGNVDLKHRDGTSISVQSSSVKVKTRGGSQLDISGNTAKLSASLSSEINSSKVDLNAKQVNLGSGASSPLVKGDLVLSYLNLLYNWMLTHVHVSAGPGAPVTPPPVPPPYPSPSMLSQVSRTL